ncbi:MAG: response regulator [Elainellaceae cyanobacterium]
MQSEQQQRIMGYFIEEAKDHLNTIEQGLLNLQSTIADPEMVSELFRAAHSVKGGAAMLGLDSIQQTSHRLEDYFKVLKECPIQVDQALESLFLRVFDTLQELLEQLQGPFGLTDDKSNEVMAEVEPVFNQLNEHLSRLVSQSGGVPPEEVSLSVKPTAAPTAPATPPTATVPEESALQLFFQSDVPARLREMLQLFKQSDNAETRRALQDICRSLSQAGDSFELPQGWSNLAEAARQAIASPDNTYRALAPVIIRDLKQAQELVLSGQPHEIIISDALAAMRPEEPELTESAGDILDDLGLDDLGITELELTDTDLSDTNAIPSDDFFEENLRQTADFGLSDALSELESPSVELDEADDWFATEVSASDSPTTDTTAAPDEAAYTEADLFGSAAPVRDAAPEHPTLQGGPEVGAAELNSLADLFEYEASDLDLDWQDEPVSSDADILSDGLELEDINDFSDLLFDQEPTPPAASSDTSEDDDISALLNSVERETSSSELKPETGEGAPAAIADPPAAASVDWPEQPADQDLSELGEFFTEATADDADWESALAEMATDPWDSVAGDTAEEAMALHQGSDRPTEDPGDSLGAEPDGTEISFETSFDQAFGESPTASEPADSIDGEFGAADLEGLDELNLSDESQSLDADQGGDRREADLLDAAELGFDQPDFLFSSESQSDEGSEDQLNEAELWDDAQSDDAQPLADLFVDSEFSTEASATDEAALEATLFGDEMPPDDSAPLPATDLFMDEDRPGELDLAQAETADGDVSDQADLTEADLTEADLFGETSVAEAMDRFDDEVPPGEADLPSGDELFDDAGLFNADERPDPAAAASEMEADALDFPADLFGDAAESEDLAETADLPDDLLDLEADGSSDLDADQPDADSVDLEAIFGSDPAADPDAEAGSSEAESSAEFLFEDGAIAPATEAATEAVTEDDNLDFTFFEENADWDAASPADEERTQPDEESAADAELNLDWGSTETEADFNLDWEAAEDTAEPEAQADLGSDWGDGEPETQADFNLDWETAEPEAQADLGLDWGDTEPEAQADLSFDEATEAPDADFDWGAAEAESMPPTEDIASIDALGDLNALLDTPSQAAPNAAEPAPEPTGAMDDLDALLSDTVLDPTDGFEPTTAEMDDLNAFFAGQAVVPDDAFAAEEQSIFDQPMATPPQEAIAPDTSTAEIAETAEIPEAEAESDPTAAPEASFEDDFADLDALLTDGQPMAASAAAAEDDLAPGLMDDEGQATASMFGDDFAELDALLDEEATAGPALDIAEEPDDLDTGDDLAADIDDDFADLEKLLEDADQTLGGSPTSKSSLRGAPTATRRVVNRRNALNDQTMRVSVKNLDNLNNLVGELVVNRNSLEQSQERLRQFLDNLLYQVQQLSDVGQRMRDLYERSLLESSLLSSRRSHHLMPQGPEVTAYDATHATGASFDALEMDRFTGFHTLSQEMIELIVRVRESASDIDFVVDESDQVTRMFRQVTTQLQEGLTRSRMVPFGQAADRLPRAVRDISIKCGKQAELVVEGRDTLIDKMILEQLYDPMTHLVNNAITHGIETPDERLAAGKPPVGKITIRTFHQGNQTVISVTDDGAGIDPERVKRKAIERKLIALEEAQQMSRLDTYDLLFHHGFSTRDKADDFAGRGVGMDVVRTSLNEIRGVVNIDSSLGQGTTFTIRLPLTLSISKALLCVSNRARIAFPMDGVEDMLDVPKERIQTDDQGRSCILWRDILLPFRPLSDLLKFNRSLGRGSVYGGNQEEDVVSVVVLRSAGNYLALQVDQVLGEQEIVIKQLEAPVPKPSGIAGATVLGDGRIMPIADVLELIDLSMGRIRREAGGSLWDQAADGADMPSEPVVASEPTVLIVDDSITVRELLSMTFNKVGYRVEQARDGQEAWEKLKSGLPCDLVFCDIEMPRMDGLELLSRLQKDPGLSALPIAMLTSRGADRHRQMAVQLGAKGYFTKPYLEEALLDAAQRMLRGEVLVVGNN